MTAELRITHAETGAEDVYLDATLGAGDLARLAEIADGRQLDGDVEIQVRTAAVLGATSKPLPAGRHRAVVLLDGTVVVDGTLTEEGTSHGRPYPLPEPGTRLWSLSLRSTASDDASDALDGVLVGDVVGSLPSGVAVTVTGETAVGGFGGNESDAWTLYRLDGLVSACMAEAGLTVGSLPVPFPSATEATPDVVVGSPAAAPESYQGIFGWTGSELWEAWAASQRLVLAADYGPYPSPDVVVSAAAEHWVDPTAAEVAALTVLDGLLDDWVWSTEPSVDDGEPRTDLALIYKEGIDGSRVLGSLLVPETATYAAPHWRLGEPDDGQRAAENAETQELPWRLGRVSTSSVSEASGATYGRPLIDITDEGDGVYIWSLVEAGLEPWAVAYRTTVDGTTHELWARELYARLGLVAGDVDVVSGVEVLASQLGDLPALLDASRGVSLEGLPWAVRRLETVERQRVVLDLVRPAARSLAVAEGPTGGDVLPAPIVVAGRFDADGEVIDFSWRLPTVAPEADYVEVELYREPEVAPTYAAQESGRGGFRFADTAGLIDGTVLRYRARASYPGALTGWAEVSRTVSRNPSSGGGGSPEGDDGTTTFQ